MKKALIIFSITLLLNGCLTVRLIGDYDPIIDQGVTDFSERFHAHMKNMNDLGGKPEGTFEANIKVYNALDAKLDTLIARASTAAGGKGCELERKIYDRVKDLLDTETPLEIISNEKADAGASYSCNATLLRLVQKQLMFIKQIHKDADKCGDQELSCVRPATVTTATKIMDQSINAVSIIETAKKQ